MKPTLSNKLKKIVNNSGNSEKELSEKTSIPQDNLTEILRGERTPKMTEVIKISDVTGLTIAEIMGDSVEGRAEVLNHSSNVEEMRQKLIYFLELDAYLDTWGVI